jgi:hypothetical protein
MSEKSDVFALLIDGDNIQAAHVPKMLEKIGEEGNPIIRRVYLNFSSITQWQAIINECSLDPVWVPNNTTGKNAADIALVIGAMDLLCNHADLTGFCIVSSDSDFTQLAKHIKGLNRFVLGIGEDKTPVSFRNACTKFVLIDDLLQLQMPVEQQEDDEPEDADPKHTFEALFIQAYENVSRDSDSDGWVQLVDIKEEMNALDHDFQSSDYQNTKRLAEEVEALAESYPSGIIEVVKELDDNNRVFHSIRIKDCDTFRFVEAYKQAPVRERDGWVSLSTIGKELKKYPVYEDGFSYRGIRNKRLYKVITAMVDDYPKTIEINEDRNGHSVIYYVRVKG